MFFPLEGIDPDDPNVPEPIRNLARQARDQHDRQHMQADDYAHRQQDWLENLDEEGLTMLRMLLQSVEKDDAYNNFCQGRVFALLRQRHGYCSCGQKHDAEQLLPDPVTTEAEFHEDWQAKVEKYMAEAGECKITTQGAHVWAMAGGDFPVCMACGYGTAEEKTDVEETKVMPLSDRAAIMDMTKEWDNELLEEFNLEPRIENGGAPVLYCRGCNTPYTLSDRVLRDPGVKGCTPCQNKVKFG